MPRDLVVGLWVERFNRPQWEIGFGNRQDVAQLSRATYAAWVYRTAQQAFDPRRSVRLGRDQMELIDHLAELDKIHGTAARPRKRKRIVRRHRGHL